MWVIEKWMVVNGMEVLVIAHLRSVEDNPITYSFDIWLQTEGPTDAVRRRILLSL